MCISVCISISRARTESVHEGIKRAVESGGFGNMDQDKGMLGTHTGDTAGTADTADSLTHQRKAETTNSAKSEP